MPCFFTSAAIGSWVDDLEERQRQLIAPLMLNYAKAIDSIGEECVALLEDHADLLKARGTELLADDEFRKIAHSIHTALPPPLYLRVHCLLMELPEEKDRDHPTLLDLLFGTRSDGTKVYSDPLAEFHMQVSAALLEADLLANLLRPKRARRVLAALTTIDAE